MPSEHSFGHLRLLRRYLGTAKLHGGGKPLPQTEANKSARQAHSQQLLTAAQFLTTAWQVRKARRQEEELPTIPRDIPILMQVDPGLELDHLRRRFKFEIVAEQEDGYVIVASEDIELAPFLEMINGFPREVRGSAAIASVHRLFDDSERTGRLRHILSDRMLVLWPTITEAESYLADIGIACTGSHEIPTPPKRGKRESDAAWARRQLGWSQTRAAAYNAWDEIKVRREAEVEEFAQFYQAEILHLIDGAALDAAALPDSFTVRLKINGKGLKDFVLNYPFIFEVVEPDNVVLEPQPSNQGRARQAGPEPVPPDGGAPAVCVIDSGIQEEHFLIEPAIDHATSHCFLPGVGATAVADFVRPGGHGTRVAGAVLYGETIPDEGMPKLPFWIQNARVLDGNNSMPVKMFPPEVIRAAIRRFRQTDRQTRIFNHSINGGTFCRSRHMSAWAAEIDALSEAYDVLVVQSAGNLPISGANPHLGVKDHLAAGREYPAYLYESSTRIANPAQSLQALTVGSIAYGAFNDGTWRTFASEPEHPSAFSRSGPGIWDVIKPEVVEFGGDDVRNGNAPPDVQSGGRIAAACPQLVRSTMFPPGPAVDRDETGTSFAAPKVARIVARLQQILPGEPTLLYRALVVQSARWPASAEALLARLVDPASHDDQAARQQLVNEVSRLIRCLGYGVPDENRATVNTDHRTTFITSGETPIRARECHIYQISIPPALRSPADEFNIRIEATLSYVAKPRRTRRHVRRYLSTWVDWKSSKLGEGLADFRARALKNSENDGEPLPGNAVPWVINQNSRSGLIRDTKRSNGTVQKDWAVVKSNTLPDHFCIAVVGHPGWSHDPDSTARYALAVTLENIGQEIAIFEPLRTAAIELQAEIEADLEVEVEVEIDE